MSTPTLKGRPHPESLAMIAMASELAKKARVENPEPLRRIALFAAQEDTAALRLAHFHLCGRFGHGSPVQHNN